MRRDLNQRPRRILMTADTVGGVWGYSIELARALADRGAQVVLATLGGPASAAQRSEAAAIPSLALAESRYRLPWMDDPWEDVAAAEDWLLALAMKTHADVVHLSEPVFGAAHWPVPSIVVGHSCVLSWWQAVRDTPAPAEWNRYASAMARGIAGASAVVAPTEWMLATFQRLYRFTGGYVIPNGRDPSRFPPSPKRPVIFAAGRVWDEAKNLGALMAIAGELPWPVQIAGDLHHPSGGAVSLPANVAALGRLDEAELARHLGHASIYVAPARYEPFGLGPLEAALAGCALVLGDTPSLREVWGDAAVYVQPDDHAALTHAIHALASDASRRTAVAAHARERALRYSPERMALGYGRVYERVTRRASARPEATSCAS